MMALEPLGDRAFLARFRSEAEAYAWAIAVRARAWHGVLDVVLAYQTAAVFADPDEVELDILEDRLRAVVVSRSAERSGGKRITLPVLYNGEDLNDVAQRVKLTVPEVIAHHTGQDFNVFAVGFQPGFPYAGYLPKSLAGLPRLDSPRVRVPAGSVAIAGRQTGVYPNESPGGWHLLGRTPLKIVEMDTGHFPIRAGDRLRFV
ncbi:MAG TPA: allophanate hydrolase subunit 1, partial [Isosphaeraceae bacterium]|nr:allophanate hydrolase subunit 1 [Isosphaeraceae bacterium]